MRCKDKPCIENYFLIEIQKKKKCISVVVKQTAPQQVSASHVIYNSVGTTE